MICTVRLLRGLLKFSTTERTEAQSKDGVSLSASELFWLNALSAVGMLRVFVVKCGELSGRRVGHKKHIATG